jgi:hypothetical protein
LTELLLAAAAAAAAAAEFTAVGVVAGQQLKQT